MGPFESLFTGNATAKILDFLLEMQEDEYSREEIARMAQVSERTAYRILPKLEKLGIVEQKDKMYKIKETEIAQFLCKIYYSIMDQN